MNTEINELQNVWEHHARHDPLWAILSDPDKRGRKWDLADFFERGRREIDTLFHRISDLDIMVNRMKALDFGCGVGRLSQPLCDYFETVVGVDISETMIELAGKINQKGGKIKYLVNRKDDLKIFKSNDFDFIYTNIVLQHIPPKITLNYLSEFLRILKPMGLLIFQLPSHQRKKVRKGAVLKPMPNDTYRAELKLKTIPLRSVPTSTKMDIKILVRNVSNHNWEQDELSRINLGNHWWDERGQKMLVQDDGRKEIPGNLSPGEETEIILTIKTPKEDGTYRCELDLVHEEISWFKDKGSPTIDFIINVTPDGNKKKRVDPDKEKKGVDESPVSLKKRSTEFFYNSLPEKNDEPDPFSMYGIKKRKILKFFKKNGAQVIHTDEYGSAGWQWDSFRYFVLKT